MAKDKRIEKIARLLVEHCVKVKKNDVVMISADLPAKPLVLELYKRVLKKGAYPRVDWGVEGFGPIYYKYASMEHLRHYPKLTEYVLKRMDASIFIRAPIKREECKNCDLKKIAIRMRVLEPLNRIHLGKRIPIKKGVKPPFKKYNIDNVNKIYTTKRYVIFDWPTETLARDAGMSFSKYKDFVFSSCLLDWEKLIKKMQKIKNLLKDADNVRILADDTDITFSIKGRNAIINYGPENMPGGEVFTAPCEKTTNGYIKFTYPLRYMDQKISNIKLRFKNGKVIKAESSNMKALNALLNTDKAARYLGEFAIGCNPNVTKFTDNLLFDEKMGGTIHLALGYAFKDCGGVNESAVHADIVKDMHRGKIFIDGKLIYENGKFKI